MYPWVENIISAPLDLLISLLRSASDWINNGLLEVNRWIISLRGEVHSWIGNFFDNVVPSWVPGREWVRDALIMVVNYAFATPLNLIAKIQEWFWQYRNYAWNEWGWVAFFIQVRAGLISGLRTIWQEVLNSINGNLGNLRSWVDSSLGGLRAWVDGLDFNVRTWVNDLLGGLRAWVDSGFLSLRAWFDSSLGALRAWVDSGFLSLRAWVDGFVASSLGPIRDWMSSFQGSLDWVGHVQHELQVFLDDPGAYLWAKWERTLWPRVEEWLIKVWDGVF